MKKQGVTDVLPTRTTSHIKEDDSLSVFQQLVSPWLVHDIKNNSDYGIDASVEITKDKIQSKDQLVTGKKFNVQLKSTTAIKNESDFRVSVKRTTFLYWYQCTQPVLIFLIDLKEKRVYYKKIEDKLIAELSKKNPNWHAQETVGIKFTEENLVDKRTLIQIETYVYKWSYKPNKIITPGEYYNNINEAVAFVNEFKSIVGKSNFTEFNKQIDDNLKEISNSIFNICIIGPSRVGKSTLINALTYREMSPVDVLPTTGVPIVMLPGHPEEVCVYFSDKPTLTNAIDSDFIAEYADQKRNRYNKKNVSLVSVRLNSEFLEKGFSITDVPGIDDINPEIKSIAKSTIYSANVILYVVSVAPHKQGEFKITDQHLSDLREIKENLNRIFLVFNKIDLLNKDQIGTLKEYINDTLQYYGVTEMLAHDPIYVSSKKSFEKRVKNKTSNKDTVKELEDRIVKYLVNGNLNGINNLLSNFGASLELISQIHNLCNVRLSATDLGTDIQNKISAVRAELSELQSFIQAQRAAAYKEILIYVNTNFQSIITHLENDLKGTPISQPLATRSNVTAYLKSQTDASVSRVYEYTQQIIYDLQSKVNIWVSTKLKQVQINLDDINADPAFSLLPVEQFTGKIHSIYSIRENLSSNVLITIFNFAEKALVGLFGILENAFKSNERIREKRIVELVNPAREKFRKMEAEFLNSISSHLNKVCRFIENKTVERSKIYLDTMQTELNKIGVPLSPSQKSNFLVLKNELKTLEEKGHRKMVLIKDYANGIL